MGLFSIFAKPLGWVLRWIYSLVPSYFVCFSRVRKRMSTARAEDN